MGKKCLLIVEDELPLARALEIKLDKNGFTTFHAENGRVALELLVQQKVDLIITDLIMPESDGFELLNKLQELGNTIPVIVLSNLSQKEDIDKAKALGVKEFLVKSSTSLQNIVAYILDLFTNEPK